jgi:hypothetical protein
VRWIAVKRSGTVFLQVAFGELLTNPALLPTGRGKVVGGECDDGHCPSGGPAVPRRFRRRRGIVPEWPLSRAAARRSVGAAVNQRRARPRGGAVRVPVAARAAHRLRAPLAPEAAQ